MKKLPRYRMKVHEKIYTPKFVNACFDADVKDLENQLDKLDAYDEMPNDTKHDLDDLVLFKVLEHKLQETDLLHNAEVCCECKKGS